ncbi:hypothetical protein [Mesorhizobium sp. ES1-1]|uniref:hypothetical protein n=1 Tax=Mesorhizobium sp. ES1-1 TaxID=2876629 RepID=UPI001CCDE395|nr:hypothetical protein [Mesorhizobium sp. ES1-1]MBZ9679005.1 hypothetical protein [Mesorhizobium sp. ES1-1]
MTIEKGHERYVCVLDPTNAWTVWDCEMEMPASLGGQHLTGRPKERAEAARAILERIHKSKLDRAHDGRVDGG